MNRQLLPTSMTNMKANDQIGEMLEAREYTTTIPLSFLPVISKVSCLQLKLERISQALWTDPSLPEWASFGAQQSLVHNFHVEIPSILYHGIMNSLLLLFSRMNNGRIMASIHLTADLISKGFNYNKAALSASNLDNVLVIDCSYFWWPENYGGAQKK